MLIVALLLVLAGVLALYLWWSVRSRASLVDALTEAAADLRLTPAEVARLSAEDLAALLAVHMERETGR